MSETPFDGIDLGDLPSIFDEIAAGADADADLVLRKDYAAGSWCPHRKSVVEAKQRKVMCRDCGAQLDPFDVLNELATNVENFVRQRQGAQRDAERALKRLEDLLRQEKNAKSRAKTRSRKGGVQ